MLLALCSLLGNALLFLLCILLAGFIVVLVHEMGHAIPLLFLSQKKVTVFIGSFGENQKSFCLPAGRLELWIKYNPFLWFRGLCRGSERLSTNKTILYIAGGPIASVLLGLLLFYLQRRLDFQGVAKIWVTLAMFLSFSAFLASVLWFGKERYSAGGRRVQPDLMQIIQLLRMRRFPPDYHEAITRFQQNEYAEAATLLEQVIKDGFHHPQVYRILLVAHVKADNLPRAQDVNTLIKERYPFTVDDYCNEGVIFGKSNQHKQAVISYEKAIELFPDHPQALNNIGYSLIFTGKPEEAIPFFDKAILKTPAFAYPYNNRGFARMQMGDWEDGLADVQYSLTLDEKNGDAYKNLGVYYLQKGNMDLARANLERARQLEPSIPQLDEYFAKLDT